MKFERAVRRLFRPSLLLHCPSFSLFLSLFGLRLARRSPSFSTVVPSARSLRLCFIPVFLFIVRGPGVGIDAYRVGRRGVVWREGRHETWQRYTTVPPAIAWMCIGNAAVTQHRVAALLLLMVLVRYALRRLRDIRQRQCRPFTTRFCNSILYEYQTRRRLPTVSRRDVGDTLTATCLPTESTFVEHVPKTTRIEQPRNQFELRIDECNVNDSSEMKITVSNLPRWNEYISLSKIVALWIHEYST